MKPIYVHGRRMGEKGADRRDGGRGDSMNWKRTACGWVACATIGLTASTAGGGMETFANYTNSTS